MEDLIANGETAANINEKGDLISGAAGNDFIYGSDKKDAIFGGDGDKRQAKGLSAKSVRAGYRRKAIGNDILKMAA